MIERLIGSLAITKYDGEIQTYQAHLVVDGRDVHASPRCITRERAREHIRRYAKKNAITIAYGD